MTDFDALTQPAYALVPTVLPHSFDVILDGVEVARLYLDSDRREWALTTREGLNDLPPRFTHWVETFPRWADVCDYLGTDLPRPATVAANTVVDVVDLMLAAAGLATTQEMTAEIARRDAADRSGFGHSVAEHRRLRQALGSVANDLDAALTARSAGDHEAELDLIAEARSLARRSAAFVRAEDLPADVVILALARAGRDARPGRPL